LRSNLNDFLARKPKGGLRGSLQEGLNGAHELPKYVDIHGLAKLSLAVDSQENPTGKFPQLYLIF
jgi:hypothetical protein